MQMKDPGLRNLYEFVDHKPVCIKLNFCNEKSVSVPRCECSSRRDCLPGFTCEDCECVKIPDVDATVCDPEDGDCFERKSCISPLFKYNIRGMPLISTSNMCIINTLLHCNTLKAKQAANAI